MSLLLVFFCSLFSSQCLWKTWHLARFSTNICLTNYSSYINCTTTKIVSVPTLQGITHPRSSGFVVLADKRKDNILLVHPAWQIAAVFKVNPWLTVKTHTGCAAGQTSKASSSYFCFSIKHCVHLFFSFPGFHFCLCGPECVCVAGYVHKTTGSPGAQKRAGVMGPLSHLMWELEPNWVFCKGSTLS